MRDLDNGIKRLLTGEVCRHLFDQDHADVGIFAFNFRAGENNPLDIVDVGFRKLRFSQYTGAVSNLLTAAVIVFVCGSAGFPECIAVKDEIIVHGKTLLYLIREQDLHELAASIRISRIR